VVSEIVGGAYGDEEEFWQEIGGTEIGGQEVGEEEQSWWREEECEQEEERECEEEEHEQKEECCANADDCEAKGSGGGPQRARCPRSGDVVGRSGTGSGVRGAGKSGAVSGAGGRSPDGGDAESSKELGVRS
jgi:hypothetical protein